MTKQLSYFKQLKSTDVTLGTLDSMAKLSSTLKQSKKLMISNQSKDCLES